MSSARPVRRPQPPGPEPLDGSGFEALERQAASHLPGWRSAGSVEGTALGALLRVAGRYHDVLSDVADRALIKARLAHLDALGASLRPPVAARGIVVFGTDPAAVSGSVPAGTALGAEVPGVPSPIVFETDQPLALVSAPLTDLILTDPLTDTYLDLASALAEGSPVPLTGDRPPRVPLPHELYIGFPEPAAPAAGSRITIRFGLEVPSAEPLLWRWEIFDGKRWREVRPFPKPNPGDPASDTDPNLSHDGTRGLTRPGDVVLAVGPVNPVAQVIRGVEACWVRARVQLTAGQAARRSPLPQISRIEVAARVEPPYWSLALEAVDAAATTAVLNIVACDENGNPLSPSAAEAGPENDPILTVTRLDADGPTAPALVDAHPGKSLVLLDADSPEGMFRLQLVSRTPDGERVHDTRVVRVKGRSVVTATLRRTALAIDPKKAFSETLPVDPTSAFAPFGELPRPGSSFVFTHDEVFRRAGASAALFFEVLDDPVAAVLRDQEAARQKQAERPFTTKADETLERYLPTLWPAFRDNLLIRLITRALAGIGIGSWWMLMLIPSLSSWLRRKPVSGEFSALEQARRLTTDEIALALAPNKANRAALPPASEPAGSSAPSPAPAQASADVNGDDLKPVVVLEFLGPFGWSPITPLGSSDGLLPSLKTAGPQVVRFRVPEIPETDYLGVAGRWMRLRLQSGAYGKLKTIKTENIEFHVVELRPPRLLGPRLAFQQQTPFLVPRGVLARNDGQSVFDDLLPGLNQPGHSVAAFRASADESPALYIGFDGGLPPGPIGLSVEIDAAAPAGGPAAVGADLDWSYHDGTTWRPLEVSDGTLGLARSGVVRVTWPVLNEPPDVSFLTAEGIEVRVAPGALALDRQGRPIALEEAYPIGVDLVVRDDEQFEFGRVVRVSPRGWILDRPLERRYQGDKGGRIAPARFPRLGAPRSWIRASLRPQASWAAVTVRAVVVNAVEVSQTETHADEVLGSSDGRPRLSFLTRHAPVLDGEELEIRELAGARAGVEWSVLRDELHAAGVDDADFRPQLDERTGQVLAVWVRWRPVESFLHSRPGDRHYTVERTRGLITFGDNVRGRIPPAGANAVRMKVYRHGGGRAGNVPAGAIAQVLGLAPGVQSVINRQATHGGADGEELDLTADPTRPPGSEGARRFLERTPVLAVAGRAAVTPADFEGAARSVSAQVLAAIALRPSELPSGTARAGTRLRLVVLAQPETGGPAGDIGLTPSAELIDRVRQAVGRLAPPWVGSRIEVNGPDTVPVGVVVRAVAAPATADLVALRRAVEAVVTDFLDPHGDGPDRLGLGWLRRGGVELTASELARRIVRIPAIARLVELYLLRHGLPAGESFRLPEGAVPLPDLVRVEISPDPGPRPQGDSR